MGGEVVRDAVVAGAAPAAAVVVAPLAALAGVAAQESDVDLRRRRRKGKEKLEQKSLTHEMSRPPFETTRSIRYRKSYSGSRSTFAESERDRVYL